MNNNYDVPSRLNTQLAYSGNTFAGRGVGHRLAFPRYIPPIVPWGAEVIAPGEVDILGGFWQYTTVGDVIDDYEIKTFRYEASPISLTGLLDGDYIYFGCDYTVGSTIYDTSDSTVPSYELPLQIAQGHRIPDNSTANYAIETSLTFDTTAGVKYSFPIAQYYEISGEGFIHQIARETLIFPVFYFNINYSEHPL